MLSRVLHYTVPGLLLASAALAQTPAPAAAPAPAAKLQFEVATVKPSPPLDPAAIVAGKMKVGVNIDKARVDMGYLSLADLIQAAFKLKQHQLVVPDWAKNQRFDIVAKMPEGATKDDVPVMLQALLTERFGLTFHRESREQPVYALLVGKGGPKLKEASTAEEAPPKIDEKGMKMDLGGTQVRQSGNSMVVTSKEMPGTMKMTMVEGKMRMEASKLKMEALAEMLTRFVGKPVADMTELKGMYEVAIEVSLAEMMDMARKMGAMVPGMPMGGSAGGDAGRPADAASDPTSGGSIFTSVQALGLKLESRKMPFDTLIVDKLEKTPTEN